MRGAGKLVRELFIVINCVIFSRPLQKILRNEVRKSEIYEREQVFDYPLISQGNLPKYTSTIIARRNSTSRTGFNHTRIVALMF